MTTENGTHLGAETDFIKGDYTNMVMLGNPLLDGMLQVVIALGAEVWTGQQRVKIIEKLLSKKGNVTTAMIENYVPTAEEQAAWAGERKAMVDRVYAVLSLTTAAAHPFASAHNNIDKR